MDYEKLKELMEANRERLAVQRKPQVTEFPRSDSSPDWKDLDQETKVRMAA